MCCKFECFTNLPTEHIGLDAVFKESYVFHNAKADLQLLTAQDFKGKSIY